MTNLLPEDLLRFGLIPEFVGRLPVIATVDNLTKDDLVTILREPRNALVKQYQKFFAYDNVELVFTDDSLASIAEKALSRASGARGLRAIMEDALLNVMYDIPSMQNVTKCVITKEVIETGLEPTLVTETAEPLEEEAGAAADEEVTA